MKQSILVFFLLLTSVSDMSAFESELNDLIERGNRAYELSQSARIKQCADSALFILTNTEMDDDSRKDYSVSVFKLYGNYHYENTDLDSAEYYYKKTQSIINNNPNTSFSGKGILLMLREFAQLYYRRQEYSKALQVMERADSIMEYDQPYKLGDNNWLITKLSFAMCLARMGEYDRALKIAGDELENALEKTSLEYFKSLRMYGKIQLLSKHDKKSALHAYRAYFANQKKYAYSNFSLMTAKEREEYWQTLRPFIADCYLLEDADPGFLYDVTLFSKGLLLQLTKLSGEGKASRDALRSLDYKWEDIQKKLKCNEAAIEFVQYGDGMHQHMAALLLKKVGKPQFISLTPPDEILMIAGKALGSTHRQDKDKLYSDSILQDLVWPQKLCCALKGVTRLYFAPDGYMHRLAIEYMPKVEDIDLYRLTSTRRLMDPVGSDSSIASILAFGAINYDLDKLPGEIAFNDSKAFSNYLGKFFHSLNSSTDETRDIISKRNNPVDSIMSGAKASEFAFRQLAPNYSSILLATHGDLCANTPLGTDLKPVLNDQIMSQSILALSGINAYLREPTFEAEFQCDGILSAKEMSTLDLSKCRLFAASACQSALGEISSDGVFGLQRGLKNAGVEAMLLSLWSVNSEATSFLMKQFYLNLNSGLSMKKAFENARKALLSENPIETESLVFDSAKMAYKKVSLRARSFNAPQFANAFILIDAID